MRSLRFLPLVFLIGIDGFAMFAPYVTLVLTAAYVIGLFRSHQPLEAIDEVVPATA